MSWRHPKFCGRSQGDHRTKDFGTREGAAILACRIAAAWAEVGVTVIPEIERIKATDHRVPRYRVVLPGFVNGIPPR
jgi:hypothetical protein